MRDPGDRAERLMLTALVLVTLLFAVATGFSIEAMLA